MYLSTLKKQINDFKENNIGKNDDYVPLFVVEEVLKNKLDEYKKEIEKYKEYLAKLIGYNVNLEIRDYAFSIEYYAGLFAEFNSISIWYKLEDNKVNILNNFGKHSSKVIKLLMDDEVTKDFISKIKPFLSLINRLQLGIKSNIGLFVNFNLTDSKTYKVLISDQNYNTDFAKIIYYLILPDIFYKDEDYRFRVPGFLPDKIEEDESNFYYYKDSNEKREIHYKNEEVKALINEELLGKMCTTMQIDISNFDEKLQEEIRQANISKRLELKEKQDEEMKTLKRMQIDRIMKAYQLLKEAIELLNNSKTEITFDRIKIDDLRRIIFKNNGNPNSRGFIEFEDIFKNNMILRMIDLSTLSLDNVDIRGLDFSYCNIHIDPQTIYNKDMTNVDATGVEFSPFSDIFDDVILDGATITDREANINLERLKSYNSETFIGKDVVKLF